MWPCALALPRGWWSRAGVRPGVCAAGEGLSEWSGVDAHRVLGPPRMQVEGAVAWTGLFSSTSEHVKNQVRPAPPTLILRQGR
jgi:hypothetical protein